MNRILRWIPSQLKRNEVRSGRLLIWYALSLLAVVSVPSQMRFGNPVWALPTADGLQVWVWGAGFLAFALFLEIMTARPRQTGLGRAFLVGALCWGSAYAFLALHPTAGHSRWVAVLSAGMGYLLAVLPFYLGRHQGLGAMVLGASLVVMALVGVRSARRRVEATDPATVRVRASLHAVTITTFRQVVDSAEIEGGAIEALGEGYLLVTGEGEFYRLDWDSSRVTLRSQRLAMTAPLDRPAYLKELEESTHGFLLRVTDLVVDSSTTPPKVFVAHQHWNTRGRCFTIRVSVAPLPERTTLPPTPLEWKSIYETQPCLPAIEGFEGVETGGRLAWYGGRSLLLTVGDHGFSGLDGGVSLAQDPRSDYGKILRLDLAGGHEVVSIGHRNPQGLALDLENRIWSTEHGPEGGDEINVIHQGGNYGWPLASYGTQYGLDYWPLNRSPRDHGLFIEPVRVFVPSIGISNLIQVKGDEFTRWKGDFLLGSLRDTTLFRVRTRGSQVIYVEPIVVGRRIRDLVEGSDGRVVLWTGERDVLVFSRAEPSAAERAYGPCSRCHGPDLAGTALGPSLHRILNREIAARPGFPFSQALRRLGGRWTAERLDEFLRDPESYVPGTSMKVQGINDSRVRQVLIGYLSHPTEYR